MYIYIHRIFLRYFDLSSITLRQTVAVQRPSSNAHLHNGSIRFLRSRERLPISRAILKSLYIYFRKYTSNPNFDHSLRNILFIAIINKKITNNIFGNKMLKYCSLSLFLEYFCFENLRYLFLSYPCSLSSIKYIKKNNIFFSRLSTRSNK